MSGPDGICVCGDALVDHKALGGCVWCDCAAPVAAVPEADMETRLGAAMSGPDYGERTRICPDPAAHAAVPEATLDVEALVRAFYITPRRPLLSETEREHIIRAAAEYARLTARAATAEGEPDA